MRERIRLYEELELELDVAIMSANHEDRESVSRARIVRSFDSCSCCRPQTADNESNAALVPTLPKRRLKHSIALAKKLMEKQKQMCTLKDELKLATETVAEKEAHLVELKSVG